MKSAAKKSSGGHLIAFAVVLLAAAGALAVAMVLVLDVNGIRRGCLARNLNRDAYRTAADLRDQARRAIASRNYTSANDMLDLALSKLGDSYRLGYHPDNSEEALLAAKSAVARSEVKIATEFKSGALNARLGQFENKARIWEYCRGKFRGLGFG